MASNIIKAVYWILSSIQRSGFAYAVPDSPITLPVLNSVRYHGIVCISSPSRGFGIITLIYYVLHDYSPWQLYWLFYRA